MFGYNMIILLKQITGKRVGNHQIMDTSSNNMMGNLLTTSTAAAAEARAAQFHNGSLSVIIKLSQEFLL
jgi:hypothetical protein